MKVFPRRRSLIMSAALLTSFAVLGATPVVVRAQQPTTGPRVDFPAGLVSDGVALYAVNSRNNTILRIDIATHAATILAGANFKSGNNDGRGSSARFSSPSGVALVDRSLYVLDTNNSDLRKVDIATGKVTTVAGTANLSGTEDGIGPAAHFNLPTQIARGSDGILYIADTGNSLIRRLDLAKMKVTTIGGQPGSSGFVDGGPKKSKFDLPTGIAADSRAVYVADTGNNVIRKIDLVTNETTTFAGSGEEGNNDGPVKEAQFARPKGLATDGTTLYILDADNHAIRKLNLMTNEVSTLTLVNGHIGSGCTLSPDGRTLYFSDTTENSVQQVDTATGNFTAFFPPEK